MTVSTLRLALRDLQQAAARPMPWLALLTIGAILGLSGPFGTFASLGLAARLSYWLGVVVLTFASGWFVSRAVTLALLRRGLGRFAQWAATGSAVTALVVLEITGVNAMVFGQNTAGDTALVLAVTALIALAITAAFVWHSTNTAAAALAPALPRSPRLLARLPLDKRGALISLSVQDHYVEIVTDRGRALILLRLSDAIVETEGCAGLQVHRSHWVARDQVRAARREGAKGVLTLSDGREIPVSRTFLPDAKEAGLF